MLQGEERDRFLLMRTVALLSLFFLSSLVACDRVFNPTATRIIVEWTTASEVDTAGFNVYRSDSANGTFTRINANLIPGALDALAGGKYRFEDTSVIPGQTYYYQLEDVELNGASTRHGPIMITAPPALGADIFILILAASCLIVALGAVLYVRRRQSNYVAWKP